MRITKSTIVALFAILMCPMVLGQTMVNVTVYEPAAMSPNVAGAAQRIKDRIDRFPGDPRIPCPNPGSFVPGSGMDQGSVSNPAPTPVPSGPPATRPRPRPTPTPKHNFRGVYATKHLMNVRIVDGVAVTEIDQTFHNSTWSQMEGTYLCPIPTNAVLNSFSIFMAGKEVKGGVLERSRGRRTYETIVSRMKDPGLVELHRDGSQKIQTRIFPIPARGNFRIKLSYAHVLNRYGNQYVTRIPLRALGSSKLPPLDRLKISVKARSSWPLRSVYTRDYSVRGLEGKNKRAWSGTFSAVRTKPRYDLNVRTTSDRKTPGLAVRSFTYPSGERFFMAVVAAGSRTLKIGAVRIVGARAIDVFPRKLPLLRRHQQVIVFGKLESTADAELRIDGTEGSRVVSLEKKIEAKTDPSRDNAFIPGLWAREKVEQLLRKGGTTAKGEIVVLGKRYGILTPYTAFLAK
ncbi:MAG: VIT domain-containing protein [Planctomycetota bacterium]|jgi:hypothetical protein